MRLVARQFARAAAALAVSLMVSASQADDRAEIQRPGSVEAVSRRIAPLLTRHCIDCHTGEEAEGGLALDKLAERGVTAANRPAWEKVASNLRAGVMPPEDVEPPADDEKRATLEALAAELKWLNEHGPRDPGRVTMRRLNRVEYNNTIRDLVGVDFEPAADFPADDVGYGFDNIGDVLTLPPILLEKYLAAAEEIADRAILTDEQLAPETQSLRGNQLARSDGQQGDSLSTRGEIYADFKVKTPGHYEVKVRAAADQAGDELARMRLSLDGEELETVEIKERRRRGQSFEHRVELGAGEHRLAAAFLNDYYNPDDPDPNNRDRNLHVRNVEVTGPFDGGPAPAPESHRRIIFREPQQGEEIECAREIMGRFARRAFRRPVSHDEVERLVDFVRLALDHGDSFEQGVELAVHATLTSPHFLFRVELDDGGSADAIEPLDDHQLAARLSYFLWSSMPDDELFAAADSGALGDPEQLAAQVRRMLADPKAQALVDQFATQWLTLGRLDSLAPSRQEFPTFYEGLSDAMLEETLRFFAYVMQEDRSVLELLDADYTFANQQLAEHYGLSGVEGGEFRRVELPDDRRGGVLTHASVLTVTSNPTRTNPVKRGKWILEQLLDAPPPPPPPDVQELEQTKATGSLRERMEQHRADPSCASCHARMDPLGFGLENFDAIGRWREQDGEFPIDASGELPDGRKFAGPAELRKLLLADKDQFCRSLAKYMLTYALGRGVEPSDEYALNDIVKALGENDHRFSTLVLQIVSSEPFRSRRGRGETP